MARPSLPDLGPRGEGWVLIQFVLLLAILGSGSIGPAWHGRPQEITVTAGLVLTAAGGLLAFRGLFDLRSALTPFPKPQQGTRLIDRGAYGLVRHPIYGGLIIGAFGWGLSKASPASIVGALVLWLFFDLKSRREERWLAEQFEGYPAYRARTRRLIPWLY
jgi:protein-S-isoprenylcysteine O-methyltransferase Ste14